MAAAESNLRTVTGNPSSSVQQRREAEIRRDRAKLFHDWVSLGLEELNLQGATAQPVPAAAALAPHQRTWTRLPAQARAIGVGANGTVWHIGGGGTIWRGSGNGDWAQVPGQAARIAVDPKGNAWVVNDAGQIWRYDGSRFVEGSIVVVNGWERPTTYVDATTLRARLPASDVERTRDLYVHVRTPRPGGGSSGLAIVPVRVASGS